jgi:hypothetical protein
MGKKKQVTFMLDEEIYNELIRNREETGIPVSRQLELLIKGYKIVKTNEEDEQDEM